MLLGRFGVREAQTPWTGFVLLGCPKAENPSTSFVVTKSTNPVLGFVRFGPETTQKHKSRPRVVLFSIQKRPQSINPVHGRGVFCAEYDSNVHNIETVEKLAT